jgi:4-amino-4-deoxy-L-arabinose transferase-like glycosyltransferase
MRRVAIGAAALLICTLYLGNLASMGLVSTDEPRYADIGRAMARTGDWITPRLWGHPWFEKPALLYWMIASGFKLGLGPELAPRLPVAVMGLLFLVFFWFRLRTLWDSRTATYSTALLATSAGWLACSRVAITDIPLAVLFSAAVLLSLDANSPRRFTLIGTILALATLAKSLPALIFFLPVLALDYRRLRSWFAPGPIVAFAAVCLPWHILCALQNGPEFLRVLFIEHQLGRFLTPALQHGQPWWFFLPVLPLLLYPWFPLLIFVPRDFRDRRVRVLAAVALFGFIFLSLSRNKLATYLLPLLPCFCALIGSGLARIPLPYGRGLEWIAEPRASAGGTEVLVRLFPASSFVQFLIAVSVALLGLLPVAAGVLPVALATGLRTAHLSFAAIPFWLGAGLLAGTLIVLLFRRNSLPAAVAFAGMCFLGFQMAVFPDIDRIVTARPLWLARHPACLPPLSRALVYGMNYYAGRELPGCDILDQSGITVVP